MWKSRKTRIGFMLAALAVVAIPLLAVTPAPATACSGAPLVSLQCASSGSSNRTYQYTTDHCCPWGHWDATVHCTGGHSGSTQGTGRCKIEGSQVGSCSFGSLAVLGGSCTSHGHITYHNVPPGSPCKTVTATTETTSGNVSEDNCR